MMEGIIPGSFHYNIKEMFRLNNLPEVKFPEYVPPPNITPEQIEEAVAKMRGAESRPGTDRVNEDEEVDDLSQHEVEMETEQGSRKRERTLVSPSTQTEIERKVKSRKEAEEEEEVMENLQATKVTRAISPPRDPRKRPEPAAATGAVTKTPSSKQSSPEEEQREKTKIYQKHAQDLNFCFVKVKETTIKRGDLHELTQLIKEGKLKYIYTNPTYKEADCRSAWEKGYVNIKNVEVKTVTRELFNEIEYNGKLMRERRTSVSSAPSQRKR